MAKNDYVLPSDRAKTTSKTNGASRPYVLPSERRAQSNPKPAPTSSWYDATMAALGAVPGALVRSTVGLPGDIDAGVTSLVRGGLHQYNTGVRYLYNQARGTPESWQQSGQAVTKKEQETDQKWQALQKKFKQSHPYIAAMTSPVSAPTSSQITQALERHVVTPVARAVNNDNKDYTFYQPQTSYGRVAAGTASALAGAVFPAGESTFATRALMQGAGGLFGSIGREGVNQLVPGEGPVKETLMDLADITGNMAGAVGTGYAINRPTIRASIPNEGKRTAGRILQQTLVDPNSALEELHNYNENVGPTLHPDFNPTFGQIVGTSDAQDVENAVRKATNSRSIPDQRNTTRQNSGAPAQENGPDAGPMGTGRDAHVPAVFQRTAETAEQREARKAAVAQQGVDSVEKAKADHADAIEQAESGKNSAMEDATGAKPGMVSDASRRVHEHLTNVEQGLRNRESAAWGDLAESGASLNGPRVISDAEGYINDLRASGDIPAAESLGDVSKMLKKYRMQYGGRMMPVTSWQALRSDITQAASEAFDRGDYNGWRVRSDMAKLLEGHLSNPENFNGLTEGNENLWNTAMDATRAHREIFGEGPLSDITKRTSTGTPKIDPETTIPKLINGQSGLQTLGQMRASPHVDNGVIDSALADHYAGELTNNGATPNVSTADVDKFVLQNRKTHDVVSQVPAVQERLANIRSAAKQGEEGIASADAQGQSNVNAAKAQSHDDMATARQTNAHEANLEDLQNRFAASYKAGPDALNTFFDNYKNEMIPYVNPEHLEYLDQLHNNSKLMSSPTGEGGLNSPDLSAITSGDVGTQFSNQFGKGANRAIDLGQRVASTAMIPVEASLLGSSGSMRPLVEASLVNKNSGAFRTAADSLKDRFLRDSSGRSIGDHALSNLEGAMTNPVTAETLMKMDTTPQRPNFGIGQSAGIAGLSAMTSPQYKNPKEEDPLPVPSANDEGHPIDPNEQPNPNDEGVPIERFAGGRVGYKSGGSVSVRDIEPLVQSLMRKAKSAKIQSNKVTEPLLNRDDSAIVRALDVAQKAI